MSPQSILTTLLLLYLSHSTSTATFLLSLIKDPSGLQYHTTFTLGIPLVCVYLSIDLGNPNNWIVGALPGYNQPPSYKYVSINTTECLAYNGPGRLKRLQPTTTQCNDWASNPLHHDISFWGLDPGKELGVLANASPSPG